ncbi:hypothetical protein [Streptomyces sp. URMC 125]|uniref:hypothetical protein n=1 Tax=Streptomyces sp. URMC 125 TaxID=3423419 RepID=UPI003F193EA7
MSDRKTRVQWYRLEYDGPDGTRVKSVCGYSKKAADTAKAQFEERGFQNVRIVETGWGLD